MSNRIDRKACVMTEGAQFLTPFTIGYQILGDSQCQSVINVLDRAYVFEKRYNRLRVRINNHIARDDFDGKRFS